jgi:predicted enzyme related to lactoylglutathione lyase
MSDSNGRFVWYELMTTDLAAARAFYGQVVGWQVMDTQMSGEDYWMFTAGEQPVAGLMTLPEDARKMGVPPNWIGYVGVADVDATAAKVTATGGTVHVPPMDIPNVGRFSVVADPQGASFALFKSANPEHDQPAEPGEQGRVGWHELYAGDQASAFDFYARLFGWEKKEAMDMGEMGVYQTFGIGDTTLGGMMNKPPMVPVANWHYYFNVGNIDEASERVKSADGQIALGPQEVPGGDFILMGVDPQGAGFSLVGSR